jgi:hypothetical protein
MTRPKELIRAGLSLRTIYRRAGALREALVKVRRIVESEASVNVQVKVAKIVGAALAAHKGDR